MADSSTFAKIRIGIASSDEIRAWSYGEVKKPETINYRTFKPERDGLFCEKIFGPVKDWECHCGRYKKVKFKGIQCERCGVEVTRSKVRRERMGHIELAAPVSHVWYLKGVPSPLALVLDIPARLLEKVLYFNSYIVTAVDRSRINEEMQTITDLVGREVEQIDVERDEEIASIRSRFEQDSRYRVSEECPEEERWDEEMLRKKIIDNQNRIKGEVDDAAARKTELSDALGLLGKVQRQELINDDQYRALDRLVYALGRQSDDNYDDLFEAGMGGAAVKKLLDDVDLEALAHELRTHLPNTSGQNRLKVIKRLDVVDAFRSSGSHPSWMILDCIPVISPELRPMVQLDGGRFATSDLNDLYRRIINRNNRLKKITEIRAPESIVNHEKRLLQEAVDALIDNGRRTRPVVGSTNRQLKSLSDMLKGKEGRFRKNLLGKRVDYSGRSVIVVGPHLKLHQCGLPKEMALELFKPFVMKTLVERGITTNIKTAKRIIDKMKPEVWDALEGVIREHPVMLNRAPTLHRLGIQAFEPVLVDGKAIQIHPLVCHAFNADFDGDQMAVHVPLSAYAQAEARVLMLSSHNLFSPANGNPIVAPIQDIVLGSYYLTTILDEQEPKDFVFGTPEEAILAYETGNILLHEPIKVRVPLWDALDAEPSEGLTRIVGDEPGKRTTVGRMLLAEILPPGLKYTDKYLFKTVTKKGVAEVVSEVHEKRGKGETIKFLDALKETGFKYATRSGVTISMTDMDVPAKRNVILKETEQAVARLNSQYSRGTITAGERKQQVLNLWMQASETVAGAIMEGIDHFNPIYLITDSGARGSSKQITQLSGMRGLMADPFGNLIEDLPIKSNFHEGLNVLEYFVSTHGARKGLADTALRTADAGYLTRRLVDVAQDVIVRAEKCDSTSGVQFEEICADGDVLEKLSERIRGRFPVEDIVNPITGEVVVEADTEITDAAARSLGDVRIATVDIVNLDTDAVEVPAGTAITRADAAELLKKTVRRADARKDSRAAISIQEITKSLKVKVRSVLTCRLRQGVCSHCYGRDLASGRLVDIGVAVGIVAAESIGEPGTQLTMRTFHTGGVASKELVGVANVKQKRQSALKELHEDIRRGHVNFEAESGSERERARSVQAVLKVLEDQVRGLLRVVELFEARRPKGEAIITEHDGTVSQIDKSGLRHVVIHSQVQVPEKDDKSVGAVKIVGETVADEIRDPNTGAVVVPAKMTLTEKEVRALRKAGITSIMVRRDILVPYRGELKVEEGDYVRAGDRLTEGPMAPQKKLEIAGPEGVQEYLIQEIQHVYKGQGVDINDKHVEVIVRQMLRRRKVKLPGDSPFLPGQIVDKFAFEDANEKVKDAGGTEATADWMLLGITDASLAVDSFLSAASFQKTTRVLTEAAVRGKKDELLGLKENVIIGRLIPAGTGLPRYRSMEPGLPDGEVIKHVAPVIKVDKASILRVDDDMPAPRPRSSDSGETRVVRIDAEGVRIPDEADVVSTFGDDDETEGVDAATSLVDVTEIMPILDDETAVPDDEGTGPDDAE